MKRLCAVWVGFIIAFCGSNALANGILAGVCPDCYDFKKIADFTYIEKSATQGNIEEITKASLLASQRVGEVFPNFRNTARIIICVTSECDIRMGITNTRAITYGDYLILVSSRGGNKIILAHEYSHVALHDMLFRLRRNLATFPAWFDEGLAVLISGDDRYLHLDKKGIEACKNNAIANLPQTTIEWSEAMKNNGDIYARAGCRVAIWAEKNGGETAIYEALTKIAKNGKFVE